MNIHRLAHLVETFAHRTGLIAACVFLPLLILGRCWEIVSRNVFDSVTTSFFNAMESELFLLFIFLTLATGYVGDAHVRVDIFRSRFSGRTRLWIEAIATLLFAVPFTLIVIWYGYDLAHSAYSHGERSAAALGAPLRWLLIACVPFGITLFTLSMIARVIRGFTEVDCNEQSKPVSGYGNQPDD
ncbi:hypothetical protein AB833_02735 [Chromatiales bacterium (ex Bugula neritina AB1)]|nr:hypothetical protein AB833_02735 [Chromatiales bacterium (ex Bugula neritina AB1)]